MSSYPPSQLPELPIHQCVCGNELVPHRTKMWKCPICLAKYIRKAGSVPTVLGDQATEVVRLIPGPCTPDPGDKHGRPFPRVTLAFVTFRWAL